jgi:predicted Zn-dependent protease
LAAGGEGSKPASSPGEHMLIGVLGDEMRFSMDNLAMPDGTKPYYIGYTVTDVTQNAIRASLGAIVSNDSTHRRLLDVDVRVGDYTVDNTHKLRGQGRLFDPSDLLDRGGVEISVEDDADSIRQAIWLATDRAFKASVKKYQEVQTNLKTKVEEEDKSDDFSREESAVYAEPAIPLTLDREDWASRLRAISKIAEKYPLIYRSNVTLVGSTESRYMVSSEGTRLQTARKLLRVMVAADTKAEDGMELSQSFIFDASDEKNLPTDKQIEDAFKEVIDQVLALREAPLVEPYTGPAILLNRASGVFFHEIFGHRIEGHRQKDVEEGQTFTKSIDQEVLPTFLSVRDDPTTAKFGDVDLRGYYRYDDEGVPAQNVKLIDNGVLKTFLLSRSPVEGFPKSNGHGRREPGNAAVSRQGNLIVESSKSVSFDELRQKLIEECKKQDKPYGLLFEDITGGFTTTGRRGPQSFKVLPVVVYRIYADGRKDELVRGADIVGTPLSCFSNIVLTGNDPAVFNGTCGAESGSVPVSAISPSVLVSQIEIEKRRREQERPPILTPPIAEKPAEQASVKK